VVVVVVDEEMNQASTIDAVDLGFKLRSKAGRWSSILVTFYTIINLKSL
jgi:hypothetical protein